MSRKLAEPPTPLATAMAEWQAARDEVKNIETANAETEERFGAAVVARDALIEARGASSADARKLAAEIAAWQPEIERGRARLDAAKRRAARMAEAVASENRAVAAARENAKRQLERVARARERIAGAESVLGEKREALDRELSALKHFTNELGKLTGGAEPPEEE